MIGQQRRVGAQPCHGAGPPVWSESMKAVSFSLKVGRGRFEQRFAWKSAMDQYSAGRIPVVVREMGPDELTPVRYQWSQSVLLPYAYAIA